jgi:hypothetical protein
VIDFVILSQYQQHLCDSGECGRGGEEGRDDKRECTYVLGSAATVSQAYSNRSEIRVAILKTHHGEGSGKKRVEKRKETREGSREKRSSDREEGAERQRPG